MDRRLLRLFALLALALLPLLEASALGLSRVRGAVVLGRPLNVTIPATVEPGDPDSPCVEADVFQGDTRVLSRQVTTRWEPGAPGQGQVRITTGVLVDEPILTLYVRVGCQNQVTRRYVLLSEQVAIDAESVPVAPLVPAPQARSVPVVPPAVAPAAPQAADTLVIQPTPRVSAAPRPAQPAPARGRAPTRSPQAAAMAQPRLKLEPLDLRYEPEPALKSTGKLVAQPTNDEERRRQAAALWRAITQGPEETVRNSERIASLERDMRTLGELTKRNVAALELMRDQTEKARGERNLMTMVAILLALVIAGGAVAVAWIMRRGTHPAVAWWGRREAADSDYDADDGSDRAPPAPAPVHKAPVAASAALAATELDKAPDDADSEPPSSSRSMAPIPAKPASSRWANSDFQGSLPGTGSRMITAEELIDIQQQADFFLSIGQVDRAIAVLETHLQQQSETSALAWFDLLDIYHDIGQREDYERVREGFQGRFNAHVPEFDDYRSLQGGLEDYSRALSRIMTLWPGRRVLEVIEDSLLRRPGTDDSETFSLEAYRELVLLYNIAKEVAQEEDEREEVRETAPSPLIPDIAPSRFGQTQRMGLYVAPPPPEVPQGPMLGDDVLWRPAGAASGVDIDLDMFADDAERGLEFDEDTGEAQEVQGDGFDLVLDIPDSTPPTSSPPAPPPSSTPAPLMDLDSLDWRSIR